MLLYLCRCLNYMAMKTENDCLIQQPLHLSSFWCASQFFRRCAHAYSIAFTLGCTTLPCLTIYVSVKCGSRNVWVAKILFYLLFWLFESRIVYVQNQLGSCSLIYYFSTCHFRKKILCNSSWHSNSSDSRIYPNITSVVVCFSSKEKKGAENVFHIRHTKT